MIATATTTEAKPFVWIIPYDLDCVQFFLTCFLFVCFIRFLHSRVSISSIIHPNFLEFTLVSVTTDFLFCEHYGQIWMRNERHTKLNPFIREEEVSVRFVPAFLTPHDARSLVKLMSAAACWTRSESVRARESQRQWESKRVREGERNWERMEGRRPERRSRREQQSALFWFHT